MNKYNIGDTVYYVMGIAGIMCSKVVGIYKKYSTIQYELENSDKADQQYLYSTVDELIEWLKTTVK